MMNDLLIIWLKTNAVFALLLVFFALVLRHETLHYFKRLYLLSIPIIAFAFPFIKIKTSNDTLSSVSETFSFVQQSLDVTTEQTQNFDYETFSFWAFGIVSIILTGLTIKGLIKVFSIIHKSQKERLDIGVLCNANQKINPFSFFNYIVLNKQAHDDSDLQKIIQHEQVHVYQRHFIDMLLAQLSIILCWLNPAVWMYRHYVTENLEFIVDHEVLQSGVNKKHYQYSILSTSVYDSSLVFANHFNHSLIKNRIKMMNKNLSNPRNMWKAIFALPLLFVFIIFSGQINTAVANTISNTEDLSSEDSRLVRIPNANIPYETPGFKFKNKYIKINFKKKKGKSEVVYSDPLTHKSKMKSHSDRLYFIINGEYVSGEEFTSFDFSQKLLSSRMSASRGATISIATKPEHKNVYEYNRLEVVGDYVAKDLTKVLPYIYGNKNFKTTKIINEETAVKKYGEAGKYGAFEYKVKNMNIIHDFYKTEEGKKALQLINDSSLKTKKASTTVLRSSNSSASGPNAEDVYPKIDFTYTAVSGQDPLYVVDGKIITKEEFKKINPQSIKKIKVLKNREDFKKYGEKGKNGVIEITTHKGDKSVGADQTDKKIASFSFTPDKSDQNIVLISSKNTDDTKPDPLYLLNDKIITKEGFEKINPSSVINITVLKGNAAINKHGDKGQNGVIEFSTKEDSDNEELLYFTTEFCKINLHVKPKVTEYAKNNGYTFKVMNVEDSENKELFKKLNIVKFPAAVIMKNEKIIEVLKQDDLKKMK